MVAARVRCCLVISIMVVPVQGMHNLHRPLADAQHILEVHREDEEEREHVNEAPYVFPLPVHARNVQDHVGAVK